MMFALNLLRKLGREERGATLVELGICVALFLFLFFGILDYGRMAYNYNMAEKAVQMAARQAAVLPVACSSATLPPTYTRGDVTGLSTIPGFGDRCNDSRFGAGVVCEPVETVTCNGLISNTTVRHLWGDVASTTDLELREIMPAGATPAHLRFSYTFDADMGFLGGPYVPVLTVSIDPTAGTPGTQDDLRFTYIGSLGGLAAVAGMANAAGIGNAFDFPEMSASLPAESLGRDIGS